MDVLELVMEMVLPKEIVWEYMKGARKVAMLERIFALERKLVFAKEYIRFAHSHLFMTAHLMFLIDDSRPMQVMFRSNLQRRSRKGSRYYTNGKASPSSPVPSSTTQTSIVRCLMRRKKLKLLHPLLA